MKIRIKGVYPKHKLLACGIVRTYWYHRKTGKRLPDDPTSPEFLAAVRALDEPRQAPKPVGAPDRSFKHLFQRFQASQVYLQLAKATRDEYGRHIRYVEPAIGLFPVAAFTADHMDQIMAKYPEHGTLAQAIKRTMSTVLTYAQQTLKWVPSNPLIRTQNTRKRNEEGQKPYTEPELKRFRETHPYGTRARLAFELGLATAFRRADMTRVKGEDILAGLIPLLTNKAAVLVLAPVTRHLRQAYIAYREQCPEFAGSKYALGCQRDGRPIHKRTLSACMEEAFKAADFEEGQRIHALRYTAAVRLFERNFSFGDIAEHTGHRMAAMAQKYCEKRREVTRRGLVFDGFDDELDDIVDEALQEVHGADTLAFSRQDTVSAANKIRPKQASQRRIPGDAASTACVHPSRRAPRRRGVP